MREIKFRGKDINGEWVYGHYVVLEESASLATPCIWQYGARRATPVTLETVSQYTGIKDSNRVEIYEGDILRVTFPEEREPIYDYTEWGWVPDYYIRDGSIQLGAVSFKYGMFEYNELRVLEGGSEGMYNIPLCNIENTEVVGNIYDELEFSKEVL